MTNPTKTYPHTVMLVPGYPEPTTYIPYMLHASRLTPLPATKFRANSPYICNTLNDHCHRVSTHLQLIKLLLLLYYYYYYSIVFGPTAFPTNISSVGTVYISPGVKWPKYTAYHCCLLPKLRDGGAMFPFSHIPIWCTEGRYYFNGKKFVLQKWGKIIIIIILSNNGLSCHMIMFHVLNNLQFLLSLYDFTLKSWMRIEILKSVYNVVWSCIFPLYI